MNGVEEEDLMEEESMDSRLAKGAPEMATGRERLA